MRAWTSRLRDTLRLRLQREPITAGVIPRPLRPAPGCERLQLTHVVVSSDLNERYLACWPLTRRAWQAITGLQPVLVLVAAERDVDATFREDPNVHIFEPVDSLHTAFQAQCVRLLYPALLDAAGVVISDVDMVPLNSRYFHHPAGRIDERHFLAYRDALLPGGEIPICYSAARPQTWAEVFGVRTPDEIRARLLDWGTGIRYDGVRGGHGWDTDQIKLCETLVERGRRTQDVWILDDRFTGHRRLVLSSRERNGPSPRNRRAIERGRYSDFHLIHPMAENAKLNELVVELAGRHARERGRG